MLVITSRVNLNLSSKMPCFQSLLLNYSSMPYSKKALGIPKATASPAPLKYWFALLLYPMYSWTYRQDCVSFAHSSFSRIWFSLAFLTSPLITFLSSLRAHAIWLDHPILFLVAAVCHPLPPCPPTLMEDFCTYSTLVRCIFLLCAFCHQSWWLQYLQGYFIPHLVLNLFLPKHFIFSLPLTLTVSIIL